MEMCKPRESGVNVDKSIVFKMKSESHCSVRSLKFLGEFECGDRQKW